MKKLIKIRRVLLFVSFLLFPITQWYFSPVLPYDVGMDGIINASLIVFAILFVIGMFFGKAFCGWIMPCGGIQESCYNINNKTIHRGKKDIIKFLIWIPWIGGIIFLMIKNKDILHVNLLVEMSSGISIDEPSKYIIYYSVISIFFILSLIFGKRASCHYICWMAPFMILGRKLGNFLNLPSLKLKPDAQNCTECKQCNKVCGMGLNVTNMVKTGKMENTECMLCGECVNICKKGVIKFEFNQYKKKKSKFQCVTVSRTKRL